MENKIMMPASYNVLSCEEMTYTEGGATFTEALLNWIPPIGWYMGVTAMRNYRKSHPNDWLDTGLDALSRDMDSSAQNMLRDLGRIVWVTATSATGVGFSGQCCHRPALSPAHKIRPERPKTLYPRPFRHRGPRRFHQAEIRNRLPEHCIPSERSLPAENSTAFLFLQATTRVMRRRALLYENDLQAHIPVYFLGF